MKKNWIIVLAALFVLNFGTKATAQDTEIRKLDKFTEISLRISANVVLVQGEAHSVKIEASKKDIEVIETEVSGGVLTIKTSKRNWNHGKVTLYVTMQSVEGLNVSGSGDITAKSAVNATELELAVSGSGNIKLDKLSVKDLECHISGSGDISLSGEGKGGNCEISISGSGDFSGYDITFANVRVRISGSGEAKINATETIDAKVSGSGDIYYKGNARINAKVSGSGEIKTIDD